MKELISVCCVLAPALVFGFMGRSTEMGLAIIAGSLASAFINLDKFQRFKGAGFEAELRAVVDKAYATIDNLRTLAEPLLLTTLENLTMGGRWGGMDSIDKHTLERELAAVAESLGIESEKLKSAQDRFFRYHAWDHINRLGHTVAKKLGVEVGNKVSSLVDRKKSEYPSERELREILGPDYASDVEIEELLKDYRHYVEHRSFRRPKQLKPGE